MQTNNFFIEDAPVIPMVLTGDRFAADDPAMPPINAPSGFVRFIDVAGTLTAGFSKAGFHICCRKARQDDRCGLVVLRLNVWQGVWNLSDYVDSLADLSTCKHTIAYVECAMGSSLILPYFCREVYASPTAEIGQLQSFVPDGCDFPIDEGILDGGTIRSLQQLRPRVANATWLRLLGNSINGEAAEHFDIVDGCCASEQAIVDRLTGKVSQ